MRSVHVAGILTLACTVLYLVACASTPSAPRDTPVSTGLSTLLDPSAPDAPLPAPRESIASRPMTEEEIWAQAAVDLERILSAATAPSEPKATLALRDDPAEAPGSVLANMGLNALHVEEPADTAGGWLLARALDPARAMVAGVRPTIVALAGVLDPSRNPDLARSLESPIDPAHRADLASIDLAQALREGWAGSRSFRALLILAAMEGAGMVPADEAFTRLAAEALTDEERTSLAAFGNLAASLAQEGLSNSAMLDTFREAAEVIAPEQTLRVTYATVCRRVMVFGRYVPFDSDRFIAGRPQRMIVYVEVDRFAHRSLQEGSTGDRWSVELEQGLALHDEQGRVVWSVPAQGVREASRSRRRDFYLIHEVELPATLPPGAYRLKVVMRDLVQDASSEASIPIRLVASSR